MKIDITKLDGYKEGMTAEEKLALYEAYEPDYSGYVKKDVFDKKASEAAALSRDLKAYREKEMTEEQRKAEQEKALEEAEAGYKAKICSLEMEKVFAAAGVTELPELPTFTETEKAVSFANGIVSMLTAKVTAAEQRTKADMLAGSPPSAGNAAGEAAQLKSKWAEAVTGGDVVAQVKLMREAQEKNIDLT